MSEENPQSIDMFVRMGNKTIPLSLLIIAIATIAFIPHLLPLFKPGPPINSDVGVHYSVSACLSKTHQWLLPTAWCTHGQAGLARLSRYALLNQFLTRILDTFLSVDLSFKLTMMVLFFILPIGAYLFLRWMGFPLAGALGYAIFLLEPGGNLWGGYALHFVITGFISNSAASFSPLTILTLLWMLQNPRPLSVVAASGAASLHFLAHPGAFMWLPIAGIPIAILFRKELATQWKYMLLYVGFFLLFVSFLLAPALATASYFNPPSIGGGFINEAYLSKNLLQLSTAQLRFIVLGIICALYLFCTSKRQEIRVISSIPFLIVLTWFIQSAFPNFAYFRYFMPDRSAYEIRTFLFMSTALVLGGYPLSRFAFKKTSTRLCLCAGILIAFAFFVPFYGQQGQWSKRIYTGSDVEHVIVPLFKTFESAKGRILPENTYFHVQHTLNISQFWSLSGAYSDKEFLGNSDFWYTKDDYSLFYDGFLFYRNLSNFTDRELLQTLWLLNVEYIWAFSPNVQDRFSRILPVAWDLQIGLADGVVYHTPWDHSYVAYPNGTLSAVRYEKTEALATITSGTGGIVYFKVRHWPNWKAWIDGTSVLIRKGERGLMEIDVPPGRHEVRFSYGFRIWDWIGYMLTIAGIAGALWWVKNNH